MRQTRVCQQLLTPVQHYVHSSVLLVEWCSDELEQTPIIPQQDLNHIAGTIHIVHSRVGCHHSSRHDVDYVLATPSEQRSVNTAHCCVSPGQLCCWHYCAEEELLLVAGYAWLHRQSH